MDGSKDHYTKWSQKEKDKHHMISLVCDIWNVIQMNLCTKQKQTHRFKKQMHGYQKGKVGKGLN